VKGKGRRRAEVFTRPILVGATAGSLFSRRSPGRPPLCCTQESSPFGTAHLDRATFSFICTLREIRGENPPAFTIPLLLFHSDRWLLPFGHPGASLLFIRGISEIHGQKRGSIQ